MKSITQLVLAGILGGAIAFGAFKFFDKDTVIYQESPASTRQVSSTTTAVSDFSRDFVAAAERANPAVVHISAENKEYAAYKDGRRNRSAYEDFWGFRRGGEQPQAGTGSGVLIDSKGTIVTNNHVVGFADNLKVTLHDGRVFEAEKIGTDPSSDLAIIKLKEWRLLTDDLPYLEFADSDEVKVGERVVAVGNPFNLTSTVTAGIISAKGRDLDIIRGQKTIEEFIQTDAVVNPGNSGGALVNTKGELIGINTAISSPTGVYAGYSFAIPSNLVHRVINDIMEVGGDVQRAMLGVTIANLNPDLISQARKEGIQIKTDQGVLVTGFNNYGYSSAKYSGVELGDVIVGVESQAIGNAEELRNAIKFVKVGDTVNVDVNRKGKVKTIPVKLRNGI